MLGDAKQQPQCRPQQRLVICSIAVKPNDAAENKPVNPAINAKKNAAAVPPPTFCDEGAVTVSQQMIQL
jgi:hypothetical protein